MPSLESLESRVYWYTVCVYSTSLSGCGAQGPPSKTIVVFIYLSGHRALDPGPVQVARLADLGGALGHKAVEKFTDSRLSTDSLRRRE